MKNRDVYQLRLTNGDRIVRQLFPVWGTSLGYYHRPSLKREFKVRCNQGKPQVNYKEAIHEDC